MQALAPFGVLDGDTILARFDQPQANDFFLKHKTLTTRQKTLVTNHVGHPVRILPAYWDRHGPQAFSRATHVDALLIASRGVVQAEPCTSCSRDWKMFVECIQWPGFYRGCCANWKWHSKANQCNLVGDDEPAAAPAALVQAPLAPLVTPPAIVQLPPTSLLQLPTPPPLVPLDLFDEVQSTGFPMHPLDLGVGNVAPDLVRNREVLLPPPAPFIHGFQHPAENPTLLDCNGEETLAPIIPVMGNIGGTLVQDPAVPMPPALPALLIPEGGASVENPMEMVDQDGDVFEHGVMRGLPLYGGEVRLWDGQGGIQTVQTRRLDATFDALRVFLDKEVGPLFNDGSLDDEADVNRCFEQGHLLAAIVQERQRRLTA